MRVPALTRHHRLWSIVTVVCLVLSQLGSMTAPRASATQSSSETDPIDPGALVPGVVALEDAGLDGMIPSAVYSSATLEQFLAGAGLQDDDLAETYADAGFIRHYEAWWADEDAVVAIRQGDPWNPISQVRFSVYQFDSDAGAEDGLTGLEDAFPTIDVTGIDVGDETIVFDASSSLDGLELDGIDATVRTGPFVISVLVRTQEDSPVRDDEIDVAEELLEGVVDTIEALDDPPANALGLDLVRFDSPSLFINVDSYLVRDGESIWAYSGESTSEREGFTENLVDGGGVSRYEVFQVLATKEFADEPTSYQIDAVVTTFEDEDVAAAAFDVTIDDWEGADYDVTELDDAPDIGEDSIAFEAVDEDETDFRSIAAWVDGTEVYRLYLSLPTRFAEDDALFAFIEAQSACLADGNCGDFQELPDAIADDAGPLVESEPADDDDTPATNDSDKPTILGGDDDATPDPDGDAGTYAGDAFDFSLSWDTDVWTQDEDYEPLIGAEGLRLDRTNGGSLFIDVIDDRSGRSAASCLEETADLILAEAGVDDIEPAIDEDGDEIAGETDAFAFAAYTVTFKEEPGLDYVGCATLEEGETTVAFIYISADVDEIEAQLADVNDLVDGFEAG